MEVALESRRWSKARAGASNFLEAASWLGSKNTQRRGISKSVSAEADGSSKRPSRPPNVPTQKQP
jgi:hypothetical protein